jgi:drug/metabolite transporter superfamily protein YnfA
MLLIAPVLMGIVLFYWLAFCFTIWAWLRAILNLCECKFIRASLWFVTGTWLLFWWFGKPHDWDDFAPGAAVFISVGVLATFVRCHVKRKRILAVQA